MDSSIPTITLFFFLTTLPPQSHCCPSYDCGNLTSISYPFSGGKRPPFCGSDGFELECCSNQTTFIKIGENRFTVLDINQTAYTMRIRREDLVFNGCEFTNTSINTTLFHYLPTVENLTIFTGCDTSCSIGQNNYRCPSQSENLVFYVNETQLRQFSVLENHCKVRFQVPVLRDIYLEPEGGVDVLRNALEKGFDVGYLAEWPKCRECMGSKGICGRRLDNTSQFSCHCGDGTSEESFCPTRSNHPLNWKRKVVIGVVAAVVGALSVSIAFYVYMRRKKNRYAASYVQSRSLSSDLSSKDDPEKGSKYFGVHGVHVFTYSELEEATNNFDSNRELGDGGFGTVYFGKLQDGRQVAVKRLYENNYRRLKQFMNEVEILTRLRHQNLVSLYGCTSRHSRELLLVYEYIPNGTVADHLHGRHAKPGTLTWDIRMNIALETASALAYLHASGIIHRDVKTNNILLDNHFVVKVADFGLSRLFPNDVTHISTAPQGTPGYVDPEYHECYQLTNKSDVYSFGVVLIELISSMPAVDITRHRHEINLSNMAINKIQNRALHELVDPSLGFESDYKVRKMINAVAELAFQCLQNLKDMRPSMEEVVERLKDIQNDGKSKAKAEEMDISAADDVVLLKNDPPPASPDSNVRSTSTTPSASG